MIRKNSVKKRKSSALIFVYVIVTSLLTIGGGYMLRVSSELSSARNFLNREKALWAAEAGAVLAYYNLKSSPSWDPSTLTAGEKSVGSDAVFNVVVTPSGNDKQVTVSATVDNLYTRTVFFSMSYLASLNNAISAGSKLRGTGIIFSMDINGNAQVGNGVEKYVSGSYQADSSWVTTHSGNTYEWNADPDPKIIYPDGDTDANASADEFSDFKDYTRSSLNDYNSSEVIYIQTNSDVVVYPGYSGEGRILAGGSVVVDSEGDPVTLSGKRMLYVEGDSAGDGDVDIVFGGAEAFNSGEDLTICSTGEVTYLEPLQSGSSDSRLNVIAWQDYNEASILYSNHNLNVFSHEDVNFISFLSVSNTQGTYIANNNVDLVAILATKRITFPSNTHVPPGFRNFFGNSQGNIFSGGGSGTLNKDWQEL